MPGSILGNAVRRVEDPELLTGQGTFVGNLRHDGMLHLTFVRSPFAHAVLKGVESTVAAKMAGVVGVFTAPDLGLLPIEGMYTLNPLCNRVPLAVDRVRFVGDTVAVVVAESKSAAMDAAEAVEVDYDPLPAVVDPLNA